MKHDNRKLPYDVGMSSSDDDSSSGNEGSQVAKSSGEGILGGPADEAPWLWW